jgi:hypothetical protein
MLTEIFMLRLETAARVAKEAAASSRFVPITLPGCEGVLTLGATTEHPRPGNLSEHAVVG